MNTHLCHTHKLLPCSLRRLHFLGALGPLLALGPLALLALGPLGGAVDPKVWDTDTDMLTTSSSIIIDIASSPSRGIDRNKSMGTLSGSVGSAVAPFIAFRNVKLADDDPGHIWRLARTKTHRGLGGALGTLLNHRSADTVPGPEEKDAEDGGRQDLGDGRPLAVGGGLGRSRCVMVQFSIFDVNALVLVVTLNGLDQLRSKEARHDDYWEKRSCAVQSKWQTEASFLVRRESRSILSCSLSGSPV